MTRIVATILWIIAAICVIGGIVTLICGAVLYGFVLIIVGLLIDPGASVWRPLSCSVVEGRKDVPSNEGQDGKHDDYDRGVLDRRVSGETG